MSSHSRRWTYCFVARDSRLSTEKLRSNRCLWLLIFSQNNCTGTMLRKLTFSQSHEILFLKWTSDSSLLLFLLIRILFVGMFVSVILLPPFLHPRTVAWSIGRSVSFSLIIDLVMDENDEEEESKFANWFACPAGSI